MARFYKARKQTFVRKVQRQDYGVNWPALSKRIKERDGNRCVSCPSTVRLEVHHILPLSRGGTNDPRNLITLCYTCHKKRHR